MTTITDLQSLRLASKSLDDDLRAVFAKYGLTLAQRRGSIGQGQCNFTIKTTIGNGDDKVANDRQEYARYASLLGLPPEGFGKEYMFHDGDTYRVVGVNPSSPKNCVAIMRVKDGKLFKCPARTIVNARCVG